MAINALLDWMIDGAVKAWETACKLALQAGSMNANQWQVVSETVGKVSMPMLLLTVIFAAIAMIRELMAGNIGNVWIVFFRSILAWPLTLFSIWLAVMVSNLATSMTGKILNVDMTGGSGEISLPKVDKPNLTSLTALMGGLLMLFMILLMIVGACSIILCMAARTFMLIIILSFAGVAFMYLNDASNRIARRYLKYVIGIILYQPLCAVFIHITGRLMSVDGMSNPISFFTGVVGMILASVMPWVLVSMVAKAGIPIPEGTKGVASAGAKTVGAAESAVKSAVKVAVQALLHSGGAGAAGKGGSAAGGSAGSASKIRGPSGAGGSPATPAEGGAKQQHQPEPASAASGSASGPSSSRQPQQVPPASRQASTKHGTEKGVLPVKSQAPAQGSGGEEPGKGEDAPSQLMRPKPQRSPLPAPKEQVVEPAAPKPDANSDPEPAPAPAMAPLPDPGAESASASSSAPAASSDQGIAPAPSSAPAQPLAEGGGPSAGSIGNRNASEAVDGRLAGPNHNDG